MEMNWTKSDYFTQLVFKDKRSHTALELFVDDIHTDKDRTVNKFLNHSGSEDFLWGLIRLLACDAPRVAGNSAYILGTIAENEAGCYRVLSITTGNKPESRNILPDLTRMLQGDDPESVMNAAGTMGTLAETVEGRQWLISEECLPLTIEYVANLLSNPNLWTGSNSALVLARISISEEGCFKVLQHPKCKEIVSKLIASLGMDEAGRGMNAAFAIGRICDLEEGRTSLLSLPESEKMISMLAKMLCCDDTGASKNACFALSCLATNFNGHSRILKNVHSDDVIRCLSELLSAEDTETGWFSAMTLHTLASHPRGCQRLREHPEVSQALEAANKKPDLGEDLKEEVSITLEILKRIAKPSVPIVTVTGRSSVEAMWERTSTKSGFAIKYQLFDGTKCFYQGPELQCSVNDLTPNTQYLIRLRVCTEIEESPFSEAVHITTDEDVPGPPENLRILGATVTQLKIGWEPPLETSGLLKGYYVYNGKHMVEHTYELSSIITGLATNSNYDIQVCAATAKGKGPKVSCNGSTMEQGAHNPSKPQLHVLGRNEIHLTWDPPDVPLGKINKYDIMMNGKCIHSGIDCHAMARRLVPDKEHTFVVVAVTTEGKFESKPAKKRTAKDEHESTRPPLYTKPVKKYSTSEDMVPNKPVLPPKKRKSLDSGYSRGTSASSNKTKPEENLRALSASSCSTERTQVTLSKYLDDPDRGSSGKSSKSSGSSIKDIEPIKTKLPNKSGPTSQSQNVLLTIKPSHSSTSKSMSSSSGSFSGKTTSKKIVKTSSSDESDSNVKPTRMRIDVPTASVEDFLPRRDVREAETKKSAIPPLLTGSEKQVWKMESLKPHVSPNQDFGMSAMTQPFSIEEKTSEPDPEWVEYAKRLHRKYEMDINKQLSHLNFTTAANNMEFNNSQNVFMERAKTFINSHRPSKKPKPLTTGLMSTAPANAALWVPELPSQIQKPLSYKFIPMQLRSPPSAMNQRIHRESTNINLYGKGTASRRLELRGLDSTGRSHTTLDMKQRSSNLDCDKLRIPSATDASRNFGPKGIITDLKNL